jgi:hypothetical protein
LDNQPAVVAPVCRTHCQRFQWYIHFCETLSCCPLQDGSCSRRSELIAASVNRWFIGCAKGSGPARSHPVSKSAQRNSDCQIEPPLVIISYLDDFQWYRLHDPLESILEGRMRTVRRKVHRVTEVCKILTLLHNRVANSFDGIVTCDES